MEEQVPYKGQAVLVVTEDEALFGYIDRITFGEHIRITGEGFRVEANIGNPAILYMRLDPHAIPQLLDMALDTGNKEDFQAYSQFMKEWNEVIDSLDVELIGYSHGERKVVTST